MDFPKQISQDTTHFFIISSSRWSLVSLYHAPRDYPIFSKDDVSINFLIWVGSILINTNIDRLQYFPIVIMNKSRNLAISFLGVSNIITVVLPVTVPIT
jgi:hypothetical protein